MVASQKWQIWGMVTGDLNFWIPNTLRIPKLVKAVYSVVLHFLQLEKMTFSPPWRGTWKESMEKGRRKSWNQAWANQQNHLRGCVNWRRWQYGVGANWLCKERPSKTWSYIFMASNICNFSLWFVNILSISKYIHCFSHYKLDLNPIPSILIYIL